MCEGKRLSRAFTSRAPFCNLDNATDRHMTEIFYQVYLLTPANCALSERATLPGIIRATSTVARHPLPYDHFYNTFQLRTFDMRLAALVPKSSRLWLLRRVRIALRPRLECLRLRIRQNATHEQPKKMRTEHARSHARRA